MSRFIARALRGALVVGLLLAAPAPLAAQPAAEVPDLFAGFSTLQLRNGLTVWYRRVPGAPTVSLSVAVPYGSDRDPEGREELAHVLEHALFADRDGRTQEELRRDVEERGGAFNASTSPDRTFFWISVGREHGLFALDWLYGVLAPRPFDEGTATRSRAAAALEIGLGPRDLLGWVRDEIVAAPALLPAGFWEREFGMRVPEYRRNDRWAALQAIGAPDLAAFHRTYYVPSRMVLMLVGDIDSTVVRRRLETTFERLPAWPVPADSARGAPRDGLRERFLWQLRPDAVYDLRFRFARLDGDDHLRMIFAQRLLERRLMRRLRWGPRAASYGVTTTLVQRGDVGFVQLRAAVRPGELAYARSVIEDELLRLRQGRYPADEFESDRAALARAVRQEGLSPTALRAWAATALYRLEQHPAMPDVPARFAAMDAAELSAFASRTLTSRALLRTVIRPVPLGQAGLLLLALLALGTGVALARRLLLRPAPMDTLRYVARLRGAAVVRLAGGLALTLVLLGAARLVAAAGHHLIDPWVLALDSFPVQAGAFLLALAAAALLTGGALALVPHKLLVFERELRLKYRAYRSRRWPADDVIGARTARFADIFLSRRLLRTLPLTLGLRAPGLLIETRSGPDLFVATRDIAELERVLHATLLATPAVSGLQAAVSSSQSSP
jgi:predicted Zn-dependent peptidase